MARFSRYNNYTCIHIDVTSQVVNCVASIHYQAILAKIPVGYFLMTYFLPSSRRRIPIAKVKGMKICSTGTPCLYQLKPLEYDDRLTLVKKVFWKNGT
jgi:hypothetical protein